MKRFRVVLIWTVGIAFIIFGVLKETSVDEDSRSVFQRAHFPDWTYYFVGTVEFTAGILLLMTAATSKRLGSVIIGLIMLGALVTRYLIGDPFSRLIMPGIIFVLAVLISFDFGTQKKNDT